MSKETNSGKREETGLINSDSILIFFFYGCCMVVVRSGLLYAVAMVDDDCDDILQDYADDENEKMKTNRQDKRITSGELRDEVSKERASVSATQISIAPSESDERETRIHSVNQNQGDIL